jgi:hypothetical protein
MRLIDPGLHLLARTIALVPEANLDKSCAHDAILLFNPVPRDTTRATA